ncbi:hypothetical protein BI335_11200 [Enemella evansiae]|nr:hypothetical protein BI335_11200 [Enemella evansiae]
MLRGSVWRKSFVRTRVPIALAVTTATLLTACGGGSDDASGSQSPPAATVEDAAAAVAQGLSTGSLQNVPLRSGDPNADLPVLLRGMNGLLPKVTVQDIRRAGNTATVDFDYSWPLSADWAYESKATLVDDKGTWQLIWEPSVLHPKLTTGNRLERNRTTTERGTITGRGATVLVQSTPLQMLGLNKAAVPNTGDQQSSARTIADQLNLDPAAYQQKVAAAGPNAFVDAAPVRTEEIPANYSRTKGAESRTVNLPAAKSAGYAKALLGTVGYATEQEVANSGGTIYPGDVVGQSGLQKTFDQQLRGRGGNKVYLVPRDAAPGTAQSGSDNLVADFPDAPGQTLQTTIDDDVQTRVEDAVSKAKQPVSIAVVRLGSGPGGGAVLAAGDSPPARAKDDSTTGRLAPGLGASPVAALALIRSGVKLSDKVTCERSVNVGGRTIENPKGFSYNGNSMTLEQALARGCRTAVAQAASKLRPSELEGAAKSLGLARQADLGTPVNLGGFPAPSGDLAAAEALIGQGGEGAVQASPLALAVMAASVQAGRTVNPSVVPDRTAGADGVPPLTDGEAKSLQAMMKQSTGSYGQLKEAVTGEADGRQILVGYSDAFAVAIVVSDADQSSAPSLSTLARQVTSSSSSSTSSSRSSGSGSSSSGSSGSSGSRSSR